MTDYQTLNVRVGTTTIHVGIRVINGKITLPSPHCQFGPFDLWMGESLDPMNADYHPTLEEAIALTTIPSRPKLAWVNAEGNREEDDTFDFYLDPTDKRL